MTEPSDMTPEIADLAKRLSKLDLDNPEDLDALFQMQEELGALAGVDIEAPFSPDDLPPIEPDPEPSAEALARLGESGIGLAELRGPMDETAAPVGPCATGPLGGGV